MKQWIGLALLSVCGVAVALTPWDPAAKSAYVNRCAGSMSQQGMPPAQASTFCQCAANGMEKEFGMEGYKDMIAAQPNPTGAEGDRKLYNVMTLCGQKLGK